MPIGGARAGHEGGSGHSGRQLREGGSSDDDRHVAERRPAGRQRAADRDGAPSLPWFFAGALFPISAFPGGLTILAKFFPLTHALAVMRYGLVDPKGTGVNAIWNISNTTLEAFLSLAVELIFATAITAASIRAFVRPAVQ